MIAYQIVLMQILSIMQWYHFAYMIISVALLGFGASGTVLALFRSFFIRREDVILPLLMALAGVCMATVVGLSQSEVIRFDSYLLFSDPSHVVKLLITYILYGLPFFFSALAIGIMFVCHAEKIGAVYCANLLGSGIGGSAVLILLWIFFPEQLPGILSLVPIAASLLLIPWRYSRWMVFPLFLSGLVILMVILDPPVPVLSEFKAEKKILEIPGSRILFRRNSPYGLIELVSSPGLRYAPGLSLSYRGTVPVLDGVFLNGDWLGPVLTTEDRPVADLMNSTTGAVAYAMQPRKRVLILDAGSGSAILQSFAHHVESVTAVEENTTLLEVLQRGATGDGRIPHLHRSVQLYVKGSRPFIAGRQPPYDLIVLPEVGTFGGGSGIHALEETYLMTVDALQDIWDLLSPEGVISLTCYIDYPPRNPLKILTIVVSMLEANNITNPGDYVAAVRGWTTMSFIIKRSPISPVDIVHIRRFCDAMLFDPALLPDIRSEERTRFNRLMEEDLLACFDEILSDERKACIDEYDFDIRPVTDDRPFFYQFYRMKSMGKLLDAYGIQGIPFFELGYIILILTLVQITLAAFILIVLPLLRVGWHKEMSLRVLVYFGCIGIGYMSLEIAFIGKFNLFFGNPLYAAAAVISCLLVFSGIGSFMSSNMQPDSRSTGMILICIVFLIGLNAALISPLMEGTMSVSPLAKVITALFIMGPLSILLGMPFPLGIRGIAGRQKSLVPWAWGINGCMSVVSAPGATLIAVEHGFGWVFWCAGIVYALAVVVFLKGWKS